MEYESSLTTKIDTVVDMKIKSLQAEITTMRTSNESKIGEVLAQLSSIQSSQVTALASAVTSAMVALY